MFAIMLKIVTMPDREKRIVGYITVKTENPQRHPQFSTKDEVEAWFNQKFRSVSTLGGVHYVRK